MADPKPDFTAIRGISKSLEASHSNWPDAGFDQESRARASGVACAVIVLRHLLSYFPMEDRKRFLDLDPQAVAQSMLLSAAVTLEPDTSSQLCAELQRTLTPEQLTFHSLMTSDAINHAVWSNEYFRFFHPALYRESREQEWGPVPDHAMPIQSEDAFLRWNGVKGEGGLSGYLNFYSNVLKHSETGHQIFRPGSAPLVVRLMFCNMAKDVRFYRDLFHFTLNLVGASERKAFSYRCLAVVKLRAGLEGHDTLRLYKPDASLFRPQDGRFPWSNEWSVEDTENRGDTYMLYFIRTDILPAAPPLGPIPGDLKRPRAEHHAILDSVGMALLRKAGDARGPRVPPPQPPTVLTTARLPLHGPHSAATSPPNPPPQLAFPATTRLPLNEPHSVPTGTADPPPDLGNCDLFFARSRSYDRAVMQTMVSGPDLAGYGSDTLPDAAADNLSLPSSPQGSPQHTTPDTVLPGRRTHRGHRRRRFREPDRAGHVDIHTNPRHGGLHERRSRPHDSMHPDRATRGLRHSRPQSPGYSYRPRSPRPGYRPRPRSPARSSFPGDTYRPRYRAPQSPRSALSLSYGYDHRGRSRSPSWARDYGPRSRSRSPLRRDYARDYYSPKYSQRSPSHRHHSPRYRRSRSP